MAKFLKILRNIAYSVALIGCLGVAIFWMNDIGTAVPIAIFGCVALVGLIAGGILAAVQAALEKKQRGAGDGVPDIPQE